MIEERLKYCRYYQGAGSESDSDNDFDGYYYWHAEKDYACYERPEEEAYAIHLFHEAKLDDLVGELPLELLAWLFAMHNRNVQKASWTLTPLEQVARSFRSKYLPKYLRHKQTTHMEKEHKGVIYILTNPAFEEYVKIGYAHDLKQRLQQLNRSEALPMAFRAYAIYEVDEELTDKQLHKLIEILNPDIRSKDKVNGKTRVREFYIMTCEQAYAMLECIAKISGTTERLKRVKPTGEEIAEKQLAEEVKKEAKRGAFHFSMCGIKPGEKVVFIENEEIQPEVIDDRHIEWNGQTTSLSALAQQLKGFNHPVQGTLWFSYKGVKLNDLREQLEK